MIVHPKFRPAWATIQRVPENYLCCTKVPLHCKQTGNPGIHSGSSFGSLVHLLLTLFYIPIFQYQSGIHLP